MKTARALDVGAWSASGVGLVLAFVLPWAATGTGSAVSLSQVVALIRTGALDVFVPEAATVVVGVVPVGGAMLLAAAALESRWSARFRVASWVLIAGACGSIVHALGVFPARLGTGAVVAIVSLLLPVISFVSRSCPPLIRPRHLAKRSSQCSAPPVST